MKLLFLLSALHLAQVSLDAPELISLADAKALANQPQALAIRLGLPPDIAVHQVKLEMTGGPMWWWTAKFWTRPDLVKSVQGPGRPPVCSAAIHMVDIYDGGRWYDATVFGPATAVKGLSAAVYCADKADPSKFFAADNADVAAGAIAAFHKLVALSRVDEKRLVRKDCAQDTPKGLPLCGLGVDDVETFTLVEQDDCTSTGAINGRDGRPVIVPRRASGLNAGACYRIIEGSVYFEREIRIEIGPAKPRAYVVESRRIV